MGCDRAYAEAIQGLSLNTDKAFRQLLVVALSCLVSWLSLAAAPASATAAGPTVSVLPSSGVAGAALTATGTGWTPGDPVQVQIDGRLVCELTADSSTGDISGDQPHDGCQVPYGAPAGSYPVTATDLASGAQASSASSFTIPLAAAFTVSASPAATGRSVTFTSTSTGNPTSYSWDFGDGQGAPDAAAARSYIYGHPGTYTVTLVASDASGDVATATEQVVVEGPPSASIGAEPGSSATGAPIQFDGTGSSDPNGAITSYRWEFGDGATSNLPSPAHAYAIAGAYTVALTVTDAAGATGTTSRTITISDRPPSAAFTPSSGTALTGSVIQFDGTTSSDPDGSATAYSWNFGDGGTASGARPSHTYTKPGTYTVSLTVTDNSGRTGLITHQLSVIAPPPLQTLIETIAPSPSVIASGARPSLTRSGRFDVGERVFCPGAGPSCSSSISVMRGLSSRLPARLHRAEANALAHALLTTAANGSSEVVFKLPRHTNQALRAQRRLPLTVLIVSHRDAETTITKLNVLLKLGAAKTAG